MEFAPDGAFALDLRDDERAETYLSRVGLEAGRFVCAIPRLRYTPYYKIHKRQPNEEDLRRAAVNEQYHTADHAKLREALAMFIRQTGLKVLACPEMTYQVEVARQELYEQMPDDVRGNVVHREEYWQPDEACSIYERALAVVSFECHSPIFAAAMGTPLIHLRQPTDTHKGQMYRDIGLTDWIFEADEMTGQQVGETLLKIVNEPQAARAKLAQAMEFVHERQRDSMALVGKSLG
jgi:polysaccharide pyruvyl transferase WcaK-like protein